MDDGKKFLILKGQVLIFNIYAQSYDMREDSPSPHLPPKINK